MQGYDDFRKAMVDSGNQLLDRAAALVPAEIASIRKVNEIDSPAQLILDSAENLSADLVVVGVRGRNRLSEAVLEVCPSCTHARHPAGPNRQRSRPQDSAGTRRH